MTDLSKGEFGSGLEKPAEAALQYQSAKLKARMDGKREHKSRQSVQSNGRSRKNLQLTWSTTVLSLNLPKDAENWEIRSLRTSKQMEHK